VESGVFSQGEHKGRRKAASAAEGGIPVLIVLQVQIGGWQKIAGLLLALDICRIEGNEMRRVRRGEWMRCAAGKLTQDLPNLSASYT
jgi:hypothetical protein